MEDIECKDCSHATKTGYSLTCDLPNEIECDPVRRTIPQESQTATQVQAATLQAVGEAFQERAFIISSVSADLDGKPCVALEQSDLTALRNGQWPAGWEKEARQ